MKNATRTINPLHFGDLEPHRFEDLIRQLAYTYQRWLYLDATGRLGRDDGLDIRGVEIVPSPSSRRDQTADDVDHADDIDVDIDIDDVDVLVTSADQDQALEAEQRPWSIQCKRYKEIGPKLTRQIVSETIGTRIARPMGSSSPPHATCPPRR